MITFFLIKIVEFKNRTNDFQKRLGKAQKANSKPVELVVSKDTIEFESEKMPNSSAGKFSDGLGTL